MRRIFPFWGWLEGYSKSVFQHDFIAGLTVAVVLIPQSMAYAMLAGLPPVYGLYTASVAPLFAALWGSLRQLASGPIAIMSLLVLTSLAPFAEPGSSRFIELSFLLAFMVGCIYLFIGLFRMGIIMSFLSHSAIKGFTSAAALIIISTQLPHLLGIQIERHEYLLPNLAAIGTNLTHTHTPTLSVGLLALGLIYLLKKIKPTLPAALIAITTTTLLVILLRLDQHGVAVIGAIPQGLPHPRLPPFDFEIFSRLLGPAIVIAMVSFAETYSVGKSISSQTKQKLNVNQEFIGQGIANFIGSFLQCYPSSGSFSRTAINFATGGKTGVASVVTSLGVITTLLFFTPLLPYIPKAALASLVINAVLTLFHPREVFKLWRINRHDGIVAVAVFTLALLTKPDYALLIGIVISLILFLWKTMRPRIVRVTKKPEMSMFLNGDFHNAPSCPQILELRCDNAIYFANAEYTAEHIMDRCNEQEKSPVVLLLDLQAMPFIDISGVDELRSLQEELYSQGTKIALMEIRFPVRKVFKNTGFWDEVKENLRFQTRGDAYQILFGLIDHDYCQTQCPYALFNECHSIKNCPPDQTYCR